jgi:bacteriocin biosynthesis cyclodehydratase domain-containing protein
MNNAAVTTEPTTYRFSAGVRTLSSGPESIRLRIGIWNYRDVDVDLSAEPTALRDAVRALFAHLGSGAQIDVMSLPAAASLSPIQRGNLIALLNDLELAGYLVPSTPEGQAQDIVDSMLGHSVGLSAAVPPRAVAVLSDCEEAGDDALRILERCGITAERLDRALVERIRSFDHSSGIDTIGATREADQIVPELRRFGSVAAVLANPDPALLRNLGRLLMRSDTSFVVGMKDGPFVSVVGIETPATGCFECFELRSLARLEDHVMYHQFKERGDCAPATVGDAIALSHIVPLVAAEVALKAWTGSNRVMGRVVNTYLATLEIQVQDLLRMPGCPACGVVSRGLAEESNFSSRVAIDTLIQKALHA